MVTETETFGPLAQSVEYRRYEVDSRRFNLEITDPVTPETLIGWHHKTGQPVMAGIYGQIATIYFNPMHNSLMITATTTMLKRDDNITVGGSAHKGQRNILSHGATTN
jgi:hypothetical protein